MNWLTTLDLMAWLRYNYSYSSFSFALILQRKCKWIDSTRTYTGRYMRMYMFVTYNEPQGGPKKSSSARFFIAVIFVQIHHMRTLSVPWDISNIN